MTTRRKLAAQIRRLLSNGPQTKDSKLSDRYIQELIGQVTHRLLKLDYFQGKNMGDDVVNHLCVATYEDLTVLNDTQRKRNYVLLPAYPMNLPGGTGIQEVRPYTGKVDVDVAMIPINSGEVDLFRSQLFGLEILKDQFCWEPTRDRIYFTRRNEKSLLESNITKVQIKMVVIDPEQIEEDDNYPVPPELENQIILEVLKLHGYNPQQAADLINDGQPTK